MGIKGSTVLENVFHKGDIEEKKQLLAKISWTDANLTSLPDNGGLKLKNRILQDTLIGNDLDDLRKQADRVLWERAHYLPREKRTMMVSGALIEFAKDFTDLDIDAFLQKRKQRRHGMHVSDGDYLTDVVLVFHLRKQLVSFNLL